jgi:hypothetical protein
MAAEITNETRQKEGMIFFSRDETSLVQGVSGGLCTTGCVSAVGWFSGMFAQPPSSTAAAMVGKILASQRTKAEFDARDIIGSDGRKSNRFRDFARCCGSTPW